MIPLCLLRSRIAILALAVLSLLLPTAARADLILAFTPDFQVANPGNTVTFTGTITNTTGVTLNATDMFLNFSGFDPTSLTDFTQLLGTPDFVLLDHHISPIVDLFSVTVGPSTQVGDYSFGVSVLDINNNSSDMLTATVQVGGSATVPEPSSGLLFATVTVGVILFARIKAFGKYHCSNRAPGFGPSL
ncbi:MAG: PEP-CTERM sorting domain-containing protein [Acidobacteriia bacterium]|nr:PEP-CTERM sorting domain-containing protein [Terriglobia bacterium]